MYPDVRKINTPDANEKLARPWNKPELLPGESKTLKGKTLKEDLKRKKVEIGQVSGRFPAEKRTRLQDEKKDAPMDWPYGGQQEMAEPSQASEIPGPSGESAGKLN